MPRSAEAHQELVKKYGTALNRLKDEE